MIINVYSNIENNEIIMWNMNRKNVLISLDKEIPDEKSGILVGIKENIEDGIDIPSFIVSKNTCMERLCVINNSKLEFIIKNKQLLAQIYII